MDTKTHNRHGYKGSRGRTYSPGFQPAEEVGKTVNHQPIVIQETDREWETWTDEDVAQKDLVYWKTLVSGDLTPSDSLTMGIAKTPPGEALRKHRHRQAEIYCILEGTGLVEIGSEARSVEAGSTVFIPGNIVHSCKNTGVSDLRCAYVFSADSFEEIEYVFEK